MMEKISPSHKFSHTPIPNITTPFFWQRLQGNKFFSFKNVFGTAAFLASTFILLFQFSSTLLPSYWSQLPHIDRHFDYETLQSILLTTPNEERLREYSWYYTSGPHLAGKNYSQASWTKNLWQEFGIASKIVSYDTYLNYPLGNRLALYEKYDNDIETWDVKYEASLTEDVIAGDSTTSLDDRIPTFHGYSANGNVTAQYVYVNYGTYVDFQDLVAANVSLEGKIALARYGSIFRGLKVKRAQELGMVGVVMFSDPGEDGAVINANGIQEYPQGPARQPSSVQRENLTDNSRTTPGYPSKPGAPRQSVENAIPSIPSIPISYLDAIPLLTALNGYGLVPSDLNEYWQKNLGLKYRGVNYNVGPSPPNLVLNLINQQDYVIAPIWNVIGVINGTISDEVIILGNHRDAWIAGGAGDPNSGSAALNEVIRSFGVALSMGWKPTRTIVFASWDGEEYGLLGSTEWVEEHLTWLSASTVAYVNVDIGTSGPVFDASASPLLSNLIYEITSLVPSPNQTIPGQTVADLWSGEVRIIGSGSDFTAFQDFAGIPSIDLAFKPDTSHVSNEGTTVYHYHSNYDSFHWMEKYGDPGFHYHATMAKILALFVSKLSETIIIPLNASDYALALKDHISNVESMLEQTVSGNLSKAGLIEARIYLRSKEPNGSLRELNLHLKTLHRAANRFEHAARKHDKRAAKLVEEFNHHIPRWNWFKKLQLYFNVKVVNNKYKYLERAFLYPKGLDGRPLFKHVIYAPGLWTGYSGAAFPGLRESIGAKDWVNAGKWTKIITKSIDNARVGLR